MARKSEALSPAEWRVMEIVWELGSGAARDVYGVAGDRHGMAANTVKTHLRRLVEKGHLATSQVGNCFVYKPTRSRLSALCRAADSLLEHVDDGAGRVLAYMIQRSKISPDELAHLRSLLDGAAAASDDDDDTPEEER